MQKLVVIIVTLSFILLPQQKKKIEGPTFLCYTFNFASSGGAVDDDDGLWFIRETRLRGNGGLM